MPGSSRFHLCPETASCPCLLQLSTRQTSLPLLALPIQPTAGRLPLRMSYGSETRMPPRQFVKVYLAGQSHCRPLAPYRLRLLGRLNSQRYFTTCQAEIKEWLAGVIPKASLSTKLNHPINGFRHRKALGQCIWKPCCKSERHCLLQLHRTWCWQLHGMECLWLHGQSQGCGIVVR